MSAVGGIMDLKKREADFEGIDLMRRAMALRGRGGYSAFICDGIGMIFGALRESEPYRQPYICERRGRAYATCIDGEEMDPSAVLERYMVEGVEFISELSGDFALALYDSSREMLLLARDKKGKRPLFYSMRDGKVIFASEVKGIIACVGEEYTEIDREALAFHLVSPAGIYGAADIYCGISEVLPGECILFTRVGMSRFFYREPHGQVIRQRDKRDTEKPFSPYADADPARMSEYLGEALMAFDYPQFDHHMPSMMDLFAKAFEKGKSSVIFEDRMRRRNLRYSYERDDRLSALYGIRATGVMSRSEHSASGRLLENIESELRARIGSMDNQKISFLKAVLGETRLNVLLREIDRKDKKIEDTEVNIRILGMLCQTVEWAQANRLLIRDGTGKISI